MPKVSTNDLTSRRLDILEGARHCFAKYGYEGATVRRLEEATGKSRGAIFHHFADKETLFLELAQQDALRMADTVRRNGLVEVMRDILADPQRYDWLSTRLEITRLIKTDATFADAWRTHKQVLDNAVEARLAEGIGSGRMRDDVPITVLHTYLEVVMDGIIAQLAVGADTSSLTDVLDLVEASVRSASTVA